MSHTELSDDQMAALKEAHGEFNSLIDRMQNAMDRDGFKTAGKLQKAFQFVMNGLRKDVHAALQMESTSDVPKETGDVDMEVDKIDPNKADTGGAGAASVPEGPGLAELEELGEFRGNIDDRLAYLMENGDFDADQLAALKEAHGNFEQIMARVQYGLENGNLSYMQVEQGYKYALAGLRKDVHDVLKADEEPTRQISTAPDAGDVGSVEPTLADRLESVYERVDSRLDSLMADKGHGDRELARLQDRFGSIYERLQNALANGFSEKRAGQLFDRLLDGLRHDVLEAQQTADPQSDPKLYDAAAKATDLDSGLGSTGYDSVA